ncbi:GPN-loop GTPase 1-like [Tropilaelaps mercedesae]|uniref:GPN-loop GTPase n=1 Tax=Tropilaelaps mercedesae TaxID=418985 RepID=A0A1V9WZZ1_9ACAR|nr:GPN-loop GTPase 1-like [Tropilaelaps mercedesae]
MANAAAPDAGDKKLPTVLIVLGMAGSGKTSWVQRMTAHLYAQKRRPYVINLDPACHEVPYPVNVDIRDTVKYKEVMKQYKLGPNGAIVTALNLFSTRFDQVVDLLEKRSPEHEIVLVDTPGQIEVFTWSASGEIITRALASVFPTVLIYVMDVVRSTKPVTFMSNMLYACSILYKTRLPFVIVMNKVDVVSHSYAQEWMRDGEAFENALRQEASYISTLASSLNLVLDEFYKNIKSVGCSAITGLGCDEFLAAVEVARKEYETEYKPEYEQMLREENERLEQEKRQLLSKMAAGESLLSDVAAVPEKEPGSEILIRPSYGLDLEEPDSEEEVPCEQEENSDERREYDSFKSFLAREKEKRTKKYSTQDESATGTRPGPMHQ